MWNAWVLRVFVLPYDSNFIMETEDNSIQRQLYNSSIIWVGAALSMQNKFYFHKELHHRWFSSLRSSSRLLVKTLPERLKLNEVEIYMFKVKKALEQAVKSIQS